ncbi:MAG: hypothetical protein ABH826_01505 [Patescibacteria group bacterium]
MRLYLNGQDISRLVLVDIDDETSVYTHQGEPESFLEAIIKFLHSRDRVLKEVKEIYTVVGPGSATSLRTTVTILNVLAFAHKIILFGFKKEKDEQDIGSVRAIVENKINFVQQGTQLIPIYENSPKITESTRDALKRRN